MLWKLSRLKVADILKKGRVSAMNQIQFHAAWEKEAHNFKFSPWGAGFVFFV